MVLPVPLLWCAEQSRDCPYWFPRCVLRGVWLPAGGLVKQFVFCATAILAFFCLPALVEWGAHHLVWVGMVAFFLVCVLFAVLGPVADHYGGRH